MPTVIVPDIPDDVYERRPEYVPGEEMPAPYDLPRSSRPVRVAARAGQPRFPDPVASIRE